MVDEMTFTTIVATTYYDDAINNRLRFGVGAREWVLNKHVAETAFNYGEIFGYIWWQRISYGTRVWTLAVLQAIKPPATGYMLDSIRPGADVLLFASGRGRRGIPGPVERALELIDEVEDCGVDPAALPAAYWRRAHLSLRCGKRPRRLTKREIAMLRTCSA
jgi:hypothetical protein